MPIYKWIWSRQTKTFVMFYKLIIEPCCRPYHLKNYCIGMQQHYTTTVEISEYQHVSISWIHVSSWLVAPPLLPCPHSEFQNTWPLFMALSIELWSLKIPHIRKLFSVPLLMSFEKKYSIIQSNHHWYLSLKIKKFEKLYILTVD